MGKSTLFNRAGRRDDSIMKDTPGVTKGDQIYAEVIFVIGNLLDCTGGSGRTVKDIILAQMREQAQICD